MKVIEPALQTHLDGEVTTLATCWLLTRTDNVQFSFTDHDVDIEFDIDGAGEKTYKASSSYNRSAIRNTEQLSVDSLDITGVLDSEDIDENELRRGLFDFAEVLIFMVNYVTTSQGPVKLRRGRLGEVTITDKGIFFSELRGLLQAFQQEIGEVYSPECRADLGDNRCKIPLNPALIQRNTAYVLEQFVRVETANLRTNLTILNPNAESGVTNWTNETGTLTTRITNPSPVEGSAFFSGGTADATTRAYQDLTVPVGEHALIDAGVREVILSWAQSSFAGDDQAELEVECFDGTLTSLGPRMGTGLTSTVAQQWENRIGVIDVLPQTRTIRLSMHMNRVDGTANNGYVDILTAQIRKRTLSYVSSDFEDRIYKVTTAGTTAPVQPTYNTTPGQTTTDGSAVLTSEESWSRSITVLSVSGVEPRKTFVVTQLTPNTGGPRGGFPDGWFNGGVVSWETGTNAGLNMEVREFTADDGVTIEQGIELFLDMFANIQIGDIGRVYPGCNKGVISQCKDKFDNVVNFRGEPYVPGQDLLYRIPDAKTG